MKPSRNAFAVLVAALLLVSLGLGSLFASQVFDRAPDSDALPCPAVLFGPDDGLVSAAGVLPDDELPRLRKPRTPAWAEAVRRAIRSIEGLELRLDRFEGGAGEKRAQGPFSFGREVERRLRRMQALVDVYRRLDASERALLEGLDPSEQVAVIEEFDRQDRAIDASLDRLGRAYEAAVQARGRQALEAADQSARRACAQAAPDRGPSLDMVPYPCRGASSPQQMLPPAPPGFDETPPAPAPAEDDAVDRAAAALGRTILRAVDCVVEDSCRDASDTYYENMRGDAGQVELWRALGRQEAAAEALMPARTLFALHPVLR